MAKSKNAPTGNGGSTKRIVTARKTRSKKSESVAPAPNQEPPAPRALPTPAADVAVGAHPSPMVDDGGVIGLPEFKMDNSQPEQLISELIPDSPSGPAATPAADADSAPFVAPTPEPSQPAPAAAPPRPSAAEMNIPKSAEERLMEQMQREEEEEAGEEDGDQPTDANPPGDFGKETTEKVASSTADFVLQTVGMLSNEFIIDYTNINEDEIADSVADGVFPEDVLTDVKQLNKLNAKAVPFKEEYRKMLKPHLQRFCSVSGVANLSPGTMLAAVSCVVVIMMFLDMRKRLSERERFMRKIMKKYAKPVEVVESTTNQPT